MRNFIPVGNFDVLPLQMALARHADLWDEWTYRTTFEGTPFGGMSDILLRYSDIELHAMTTDAGAVTNDTELLQFYPAWQVLPEVKPIVFELMRRFQGVSLGRVMIARLPAGGIIKRHADNYGRYALRKGGMRFHVAVQALPGCAFHCGDETIQMTTGTCWWFNHKEPHSAENNSADERIHLLVDIQTS